MRVTSQRWLATGAVGLALALSSLTTVRADAVAKQDQVPPATPAVKTVIPPAPQVIAKTVLTGSNLPQQYRRLGRMTDTSLNVIVIDQSEIERSGVTSLAALLRGVAGVKIH